MKKNIVAIDDCHIGIALVKFEHPEWGVRYKSLVITNDNEVTNEEIIEFAEKEKVGAEEYSIDYKIANVKNNLIIGVWSK